MIVEFHTARKKFFLINMIKPTGSFWKRSIDTNPYHDMTSDFSKAKEQGSIEVALSI